MHRNRDATEVARPERNSAGDGEGAQGRLHLALFVRGKEAEGVGSIKLVWNLPIRLSGPRCGKCAAWRP